MKRISTILKSIPSIENMQSSSGNDVLNQFIIKTDEAEIFQSYYTTIAICTGGKIYLDKNSWDYSTTTVKYCNQFLGIDKRETERRIANGRINLVNLNK